VIIELFGPPGAGKTTFALALGQRLRSDGYDVRVRSSARPGEETTPGRYCITGPTGRWFDPARRLARPVREMIAALSGPADDVRFWERIDALVSMVPRIGPIRSLRERQYLIRLSAAWRGAQSVGSVTIFDQGFVQWIALILLFLPETTKDGLAAALEAAPTSDLAIGVDAPVAEIERRLLQRSRAIGKIGGLFESNLGGSLDQTRAAKRLFDGLAWSGRKGLAVQSADQGTLEAGVELARAEIRRIQLA
jgi:AAA domain